MSLETHEEPWLRDALADLVTHEPPMAQAVVDDVRRGEAARAVARRRRTSVVAIAAVLAVVAVPLSLLLRSGSTVTPAVPTPTTGAPTDLPTTLSGLGWSITATRTSATVPDETDYSLLRTDGSGTTTHLWLLVAKDASGPGHYLAQCTHQTCDVGHAGGTGPIMGADRNDHGHDELGANPRTLDPPGFGSYILDWTYRSGTVVEAVSLPATTTQTAVPQVGPPSPALSLADLRTILTAVGDPFALPPVATMANHTPVYVPDAQWAQAVSSAIPGSAEVTVTDPGSFEGWKTAVVRMRLQRGGTTTSVVVSLARESQCLGTCAGLAVSTSPPCPVSDGSCTVVRPWTVAPADGVDRHLGVIEQTLTSSEANRGYAGTYVLRTGVQLFGPAQLSVESDSREPGANGQWLGSSAPALTADELLTLARDLPLPESWRAGITSGAPSVSPTAAASTAPTSSSNAPSASAEPTAAAQVAAAKAHPCTSADLTITQPWHDGATGTTLYGLGFHNRSATACGLVGFPEVMLEGAVHKVLTFVVTTNVGGSGTPMAEHAAAALLLAPGGDAHSLFTKYRCDTGSYEGAPTLQVTVNSWPTARVSLSLSAQYCNGGLADPGNTLDVYGYYPGAAS